MGRLASVLQEVLARVFESRISRNSPTACFHSICYPQQQNAPRLPQRSGSEASSGLLLGLPLGQYSLVGQRALEQPASVSAARPANGGGRTCAGVVR